ncbi:MAG TPA: hypothetical protein PK953_11885, partial [Smithellaceae bacterium]|nr:hypothetical protein [Smithellaceae bacterium]
LRLAKGFDKTRLRLKQLSLLIFRFAKIYITKRSQWPLKEIALGNSPSKQNPRSRCGERGFFFTR